MSNHNCDSLITTCIDFRFQEFINKWISSNFQPRSFDRVAFAGGVKSLDTIMSQIDISYKLHHIKKVVLINHEDCGAYGEAGTAEKHAQDLKNAAAKIKDQYPNLEIETYYLRLTGEFEKII